MPRSGTQLLDKSLEQELVCISEKDFTACTRTARRTVGLTSTKMEERNEGKKERAECEKTREKVTRHDGVAHLFCFNGGKVRREKTLFFFYCA